MNLTDLAYALPPRQLLAITIASSVFLYAVAANLGWVLQHQRPAGVWEQRISWMQSSRIMRVLKELARWLYYLGLPYATLMVGYDTVRALGVWNLDWLAGAIPALILAVGSAMLAVWIWRPYARIQHPHAVDESRWNWARHAVESFYQQAHWAFYRSGPILWVGDVYWGSFFGLGLAYLEGWSNPTVRAGVREVTRADAPLWTGTLAVITTVIFIYTQNLWYCLAVHLLLDLGFRGLIGFPRASALDQGFVSSFEFAGSLYDSDSTASDSYDSSEDHSSGLDGTGRSLFDQSESTEFDAEEYSASTAALEPDTQNENDGAENDQET